MDSTQKKDVSQTVCAAGKERPSSLRNLLDAAKQRKEKEEAEVPKKSQRASVPARGAQESVGLEFAQEKEDLPSSVCCPLLSLSMSVLTQDVVQAVIMEGLRCPTVWKRLEAIERFSLLWRCSHLQQRATRRYLYSMPMIAVLQSLEESEPRIRYGSKPSVQLSPHVEVYAF